MAGSIVAPIVVATVAFARTAHADVDPTATFEWVAPEGCPSQEVVRESIRTLVRSGAAPVRAQAVATAGPPWTARIRIDHDDERGDRELEASTCEALGQAVALVVALAIDRAETAPPEDVAAAPVKPTPAPTPPATVAEKPVVPPSGDERRFATHVGLAARSGLLPSITPGVEAGIAWAGGALELSGGAALYARSSTSVRGPGGSAESVTGSFVLTTAQVHVGWVLHVTRTVRVVPFGGMGLAYLRGVGRGADVDESASDWLPMPLAGVEGRVRSGRLEPYVTFEGGAPLGRSSFEFRGVDGALFQPELVSLRASAGVRVLLF